MTIFKFTKLGIGTFRDLPADVQKRILQKMRLLRNHPDIFSVVNKLNDIFPATHQLRIGNYRLMLELKDRNKTVILFHVLRAGHRKDIYRLI